MNKFIYLILLLVLFSACEETYMPSIDIVPGSLVVEARLTNDNTKNFIRLSQSRDFYSTDPVIWATGAKVELVEAGEKTTIKGSEIKPGNYAFPQNPSPGKSYALRITWQNNVYQSDFSTMPPIPAIDSFYTENYIQKTIKLDGYGVPVTYEIPGRQILVNAPLSSELNYFRFNCRAVIQWVYSKVPGIDSIPEPIDPGETKSASLNNSIATPRDTVLYGWITITNASEYDLAGPKEYSTSSELARHVVRWLDYRGGLYLDSTTQRPYNWIFTIEQFGLSKATYDFYTMLNQQFEANGNLFDPVTAQVESNVHCVNDPTKKVLGFFDLSSYARYRYYLNLGSGSDNTVVLRRLNYFYDIPDRGYIMFYKPEFWETDYPK